MTRTFAVFLLLIAVGIVTAGTISEAWDWWKLEGMWVKLAEEAE